MNTGVLKLRLPLEEAMRRYAAWVGRPEVRELSPVKSRRVVDAACDEKGWLGDAVVVHAVGDWTLFEDLSGGLACRPAEDWLKLAGDEHLLFLSYNDAIPYGELVEIDFGEVRRLFLHDASDPSADRDEGRDAQRDPLRTWLDVANRLDDDPEFLSMGDVGLLWIHERSPES